MAQHVCANLKEITEASGTEDAEADAEYDAALKEAIQGIQEAVTSITEHMEEVRLTSGMAKVAAARYLDDGFSSQ